ncbi:MAG: GntR family transcriptional regulator [Epulopiscium sp. Nele67-Bin005]|nr:MAG: GntR family transcriptional regulator [Epulopiscium sp. Nele67-Bin005]
MALDKVQISMTEYQPLRDIVFHTLRQAILEGELQPGERLMEIQLGERLGVSRTPIREALRKLELEGLVIMIPRKGAQVAPFTKKDIADVLEVRGALEALAAKIVCRQLTQQDFLALEQTIKDYEVALYENNMDKMIIKDVEFHEIIFNATDNERLIQMFNTMREQVQRYRVAYLKHAHDRERILTEHINILKALKLHDADLAGKLATEHIQTQCDCIMAYIDKQQTGD